MHQHRILKGVKIVFFIALTCIAFGFVVRGVWNELVPPIFGWHTISFWQAIGLLFLSRILFGGLPGPFGGRRNHWRQRMQERMEHMTPEQREQFRRGMRCGRGPFAAAEEPQS